MSPRRNSRSAHRPLSSSDDWYLSNEVPTPAKIRLPLRSVAARCRGVSIRNSAVARVQSGQSSPTSRIRDSLVGAPRQEPGRQAHYNRRPPSFFLLPGKVVRRVSKACQRVAQTAGSSGHGTSRGRGRQTPEPSRDRTSRRRSRQTPEPSRRRTSRRRSPQAWESNTGRLGAGDALARSEQWMSNGLPPGRSIMLRLATVYEPKRWRYSWATLASQFAATDCSDTSWWYAGDTSAAASTTSTTTIDRTRSLVREEPCSRRSVKPR